MPLASYVAIVRRRILAILLCLIAGLVGSAIVAKTTPKEYASSATFFVNVPATTTLANEQLALQVTGGLISSFQKLVTTRTTAFEVAQKLGISPGLVAGHVSASLETNTLFIDVTATSDDPGQARILADTTADVVIQRIPQIQGSQSQAVTATIVDRALVPSAPFQPHTTHIITIGALLGLVAGIALAALLEALDSALRSSDQAVALSGAPLLGIIPRRRGADAARLVVSEAAGEPYRALRTAITFLNPDDPPQVLLISSPTPSDGKTTTATNLAVSLATTGRSVVLIDADLRRGSLSRTLGLPRESGLSSIVMRQSTLSEVVKRSGNVDFIATGPLPPNPSELLGSQSMVAALEQLRQHYDLIVIDAPPVLAVTDAVVLAPHVDAVILVARHGHTARGALTETRRQLSSVGVHAAGIVLNAVPKSEANAYYGRYVYTIKPRRLGSRRAG